VTVEHYFTPNGTDIHHKGIQPDVKVSLTQAQQQELGTHPALIGTHSDPQYARAVNVLTNNNLAKYPRNQQSLHSNIRKGVRS
jgi:carboxyl-terminal processing protease